jgi:hypothetical protein
MSGPEHRGALTVGETVWSVPEAGAAPLDESAMAPLRGETGQSVDTRSRTDLSYAAPWLESDGAVNPHRLVAQGGMAAGLALVTSSEQPEMVGPSADTGDDARRLGHSPEFRREYTEKAEDWDAFHHGGGRMAPPRVLDSSTRPKCLTPEGERLELERRYGRPFTHDQVLAYREAVGMSGSRAAFETWRTNEGIYPDGLVRTREAWEREIAARTLGVLTSGPLAAIGWRAAATVTPDPVRQLHAGGAMAALEQAAGAFGLAQSRPGQAVRVRPGPASARLARPTVHDGQQGKHVPGHNNFLQGRSRITHPNPQHLVSRFAGKGQPIRGIPGQPGSRERVDFGVEIGVWVDERNVRPPVPTTNGVIHYGKDGTAHIVPARP